MTRSQKGLLLGWGGGSCCYSSTGAKAVTCVFIGVSGYRQLMAMPVYRACGAWQKVRSYTTQRPSSEEVIWQCSSPELFLRPKAEFGICGDRNKPLPLIGQSAPSRRGCGVGSKEMCSKGATDTVATKKRGHGSRKKQICEWWLGNSKSFWYYLIQVQFQPSVVSAVAVYEMSIDCLQRSKRRDS